MHAAIMQFQLQTDKIQEGMQILRDTVRGPIRAARGFAGALGLTDPRTAQGLALTLWATIDDLQAAQDLFLPAQPHLSCALIGGNERRTYVVAAHRALGPAGYAWVRQIVRRPEASGQHTSARLREPVLEHADPRGFLGLVHHDGDRVLDISLWGEPPAFPPIGKGQGGAWGLQAGAAPWKVGAPHAAVYAVRFQIEAPRAFGVVGARGGVVRACPARVTGRSAA